MARSWSVSGAASPRRRFSSGAVRGAPCSRAFAAGVVPRRWCWASVAAGGTETARNPSDADPRFAYVGWLRP
eukprot:7873484-Lingulodinium_polyedra.AAC.1